LSFQLQAQPGSSGCVECWALLLDDAPVNLLMLLMHAKEDVASMRRRHMILLSCCLQLHARVGDFFRRAFSGSSGPQKSKHMGESGYLWELFQK
jgi:hypothetical protein